MSKPTNKQPSNTLQAGTQAQDQIQRQAQGQNLARLRKARGLSAQALADTMTAAGTKVSRGAITNWERGVNGIVLSKLPTLAQVLGVEPSDILLEAHTAAGTESAAPTPKTLTPARVEQAMTTEHPNTSNITLKKSNKLTNVCYDIRGPLLKTAMRMEAEGHHIIKLNVGNPAPFGFDAPQEILYDVSKNLHRSVGYSDSKGIFSARKAILQYYQARGLKEAVNVDDVYLGNGVSELIVMTMQALLNNGDEVLIPAPDYPLWTAATNLSGGKAVHYLCDEDNDWQPDLADIESKISPSTRAILVINPNNPTGAVYSKEVLANIVAVARKHNLVLLADEIYDRVLYDDAVHHPLSILAKDKDILVLTFNGLSKSHRIAGFRAGWLMLSGKKDHAEDFIEGLDMLSSMRLCANVPAQYAIQTSLGGYQSIQDLTTKGGRLYEQRELAYNMLSKIEGVSAVKPKGAMYFFVRLDPKVYPIEDDTDFMMQLLREQKVLMVQGTGFNWPKPDHFRLVFLPTQGELKDAILRLDKFLARKRKQMAA